MIMSDLAVMPYQHYKDACDAIRAKGAGSPSIKSAELAPAISSIESGAAPAYDWSPHIVPYGNGYHCCRVVNDGSYPTDLIDWFKSEQKITRTYLLEAYCAASGMPKFESFPPYMLISGVYPLDGCTVCSGWGTAASVWGVNDALKVTGGGQVMWIGCILENVRSYNLMRKIVFDVPAKKSFSNTVMDVDGIFFVRCGGLYDSIRTYANGGSGIWTDSMLTSDTGAQVHVAVRHQWGAVRDAVSINVTTKTANSCFVFADRILI